VALIDERPRRLHTVVDRIRELDRLLVELEPAARDARDVEQIVDESPQVPDLTLEPRARATAPGSNASARVR
jgi:hypothetical protein